MDQMQNSAPSAREKDLETFEKILKFLPDDKILDFTKNLLSGNLYTKEHMAMFDDFSGYSERITVRFFDEQIQNYFSNFKKSLHKLENFLENNFFPNENKINYTFHLFPQFINYDSVELIETKKNEQKRLTEYKLWCQRKKKMYALIKKFSHDYRIFIENGSDIFFHIDKETVYATKKFPHKLPSGTIWENFIIQFLTDNSVLIQVMGKNEKLDYKAMGFEDKRNAKPNLQWELLKLLSKRQGEISWKNSEADEKFKKIKERLANQLKIYFSIDYDPFFRYQENKSYKIKITLIPPPENINNTKNIENDLTQETEDIFSDLMT